MTLIARTFPELCQALRMSGLSFARMTRSPVRIAGMWRCEVKQ